MKMIHLYLPYVLSFILVVYLKQVYVEAFRHSPNILGTVNIKGKFRKLSEHSEESSRGIALCTGRKMVDDARAVIYQVRNVFHSRLPIAVMHCDELSDDIHNSFDDFEDIRIVNMCNGHGLFGLDHGATQGRLHSWFCKTATLVTSPFNETIISDLDVVWFKQPDKLFNAPAYRQTGTIFFRDRVTFNRKKQSINDKILQDVIEEFIMKQSIPIGVNQTISAEIAASKVHENGFSFFWRNVADRDAPTLDNFQDSSVIVVNRPTHPKFIKTIENILPEFNIGYGDKEIYWISAIISGEPFSFEPFLSGLYGDCGLLLHYDPNQIDDPINATPFYMNGEWILEKAHSVGHDLEFEMPNPVVASHNLTLLDLHASRGCSCGYFGCRPIPEYINLHMVRAIWERLTRRINHDVQNVVSSSEDQLLERCVEIYLQTQELINKVLINIRSVGDCGRFGCPYLPLNISASYVAKAETLCIPLSFNPEGAASIYQNLTLRMQRPLIMPEGMLLKASGRSVYLVKNGTIHEFPDGDTFLSMGYEWDQISGISDAKLKLIDRGDPIPSIKKRKLL